MTLSEPFQKPTTMMYRNFLPNHPEVVKRIDDSIRRVKDAGKAPGILCGDVQLAQHYIEVGCLFTAVGSDIALLANSADTLAAMFRSQNPGRRLHAALRLAEWPSRAWLARLLTRDSPPRRDHGESLTEHWRSLTPDRAISR
jgi:hypothetical protein